MHASRTVLIAAALIAAFQTSPRGQMPAAGALPPVSPDPNPAITALVSRLDLERYKTTIKGLTQFGDRLQGTERNRRAADWIEAQLRSYGCPTERIKYTFNPTPVGPAAATPPSGPAIPRAVGGGRPRGVRMPTDPNNDAQKQPNADLRALNAETPVNGPREEVYCTKVGTGHPNEMYIVSAHMDGRGFGEAANDNGSGTALVMELARIFSMPDVQTDRTIRFALWNNEESSGYAGANAYIQQRRDRQGKEDPPGSGKYPEPVWLGVIQHDMMLFDHGMRRPDGSIPAEQRPEADVNIEFQSTSKQTAGAQALAWFVYAANEKYATDYPAQVGPHMTNTDSSAFMDLVPAISFRENERGVQVGSGWDPQWHQPTDLFTTYTDKDFRLGLNAAQTTMGAVGELTGARIASAGR